MGCVLHMRLKLLWETVKKAVSNSSDTADTFQVAERKTDGTRDVLSNLRRFSSWENTHVKCYPSLAIQKGDPKPTAIFMSVDSAQLPLRQPDTLFQYFIQEQNKFIIFTCIVILILCLDITNCTSDIV